jgi:hypothetical protein
MKSLEATQPAAGETAHTPTPWRLATRRETSTNIDARIVSEDIGAEEACLWEVANLNGGDAHENAAFIVRACNEYAQDKAEIAALVFALKEIAEAVANGEPIAMLWAQTALQAHYARAAKETRA